MTKPTLSEQRERDGEQAGPMLVRHVIDGHTVLLPADAVIAPRAKIGDEPDFNAQLGGLWE